MKLYERQGDELQETKYKEREQEVEGKGKQGVDFSCIFIFSFNIP